MPSVPATPAARQRARVTVITRTKDRPLLLRRCVESVLSQSFADWLHVIVNDGGNLPLVQFLVEENAARYAGRVEIVSHPVSEGMQNASNRGLDEAAGEYVVIHDDDDSWERDFLRACVEFLDAQGPDGPVQGVATQTNRVLEEFNESGGIHEHSREHYLPIRAIGLSKAAGENPFAPIAFVYRRAVHARIGRFDESFSVVGDWDFNLRFLAQYDIGVIDRRLACDRGELAVELLTELGVDEIVPWSAQRSVVVWRGERAAKSLSRWRSTAREAGKQSRQAWFPVVSELAGTADVCRRVTAAAAAFVLHESAIEALAGAPLPPAGEIVLVIGPEGGVTEGELAALGAAGARAVRLGDPVLRTSTAGAAALAVLSARMGRWD